MRLFADENIPWASIRILRAAGHDVIAIAEVAAGMSDFALLDWAAREGRLVLTLDRDLGRLAQGHGGMGEGGVVIFRIPRSAPQEPALALQALLARGDLALCGRLTVVDRTKIRQRILSPGKPFA